VDPSLDLKDMDGILTRFNGLRHVWIRDTVLVNWDALDKILPEGEQESESYDQIRAHWLDLREQMPKTLETLHVEFNYCFWTSEQNTRYRAVAFCARMEDFVRSKKIQTH
jgi:hypothetical protein